MFFALFISVTYLTHLAFGEGVRVAPCGEFDWNNRCDLSGTLHMILGDGIVGASIGLVLAYFFYRLSYRNQLRIEQIIESELSMKNKRKDYAVGHLRNLISLLFFTLNMLKGSLNHYNNAGKLSDDERKLWLQSTSLSRLRADEAKIGRILISVRNILVAANDVLEPEVVNRIDGVCNFIGELSVEENPDGTMEFPKMTVSKIKVEYLLEMLKTYSIATRSFRDIEQYYESTAFLSKGKKSTEVSGGVLNQEVQH